MSQTQLYTSEPLPLRRLRNVRDLGGYPYVDEAGHTGRTACGVFLRSGALGRASRSDIAALWAYGLALVIDVRSNFELRIWPDPFADGGVPGVVYEHIPMMDQLNSNGFQGLLPENMFNVYRDLLDGDPDDFRVLLEAADQYGAGGCTLFHCRAGKDRTGVIAMLLLGLAGVDDEHIVADYAATQQYMGRGLRAQRIAVSVLIRKKVPRCLFEADPHEMERTLDYLHRTYGGAYRYLRDVAGCSEELLRRTQSRLRQ
ncbi:tyrosine-protein phosphatase [Collinsella sp. An2]|uniref:tyrosine-protein phosphatase n=1 Tax=Collinsella sp. An2 TaxID=1965585 RepID=UPI000B367DFC|nr:tyrosine-protein phosphatase [Collinsella sp. An2]OUP10519.1 hypothetical protein B5F33_02845 [Collinsella sp. An2]